MSRALYSSTSQGPARLTCSASLSVRHLDVVEAPSRHPVRHQGLVESLMGESSVVVPGWRLDLASASVIGAWLRLHLASASVVLPWWSLARGKVPSFCRDRHVSSAQRRSFSRGGVSILAPRPSFWRGGAARPPGARTPLPATPFIPPPRVTALPARIPQPSAFRPSPSTILRPP